MSEFIFSAKPTKGKTSESIENINENPEILNKGLIFAPKLYPLTWNSKPYQYSPWTIKFLEQARIEELSKIKIELEFEEEKTTKSANKK